MNLRHTFLHTLFFFCISVSALGQGKQPQLLKVGYSLSLSLITEEKLRYSKSTGIDYLETSFGGLIDSNLNFKYSDEEMRDRVKKVKESADKAGIVFWSVHMPYGKFIDISFPDEAARQKVVALHKKVLSLCRILEPKIILFHPSYYLGLNEREIRKSQMVKSAIELNEAVKAMRATMVIENMLGPELLADAKRERPLCRSVDETLELMNRLPDDIYSAVDMNHISHPEKLIRAVGRRLKSVHVADGTGKAENHFFPCSGEGQNNWTDILSALYEVGYTGPFMFESHYKDVKDLRTCYETLYHAYIK